MLCFGGTLDGAKIETIYTSSANHLLVESATLLLALPYEGRPVTVRIVVHHNT